MAGILGSTATVQIRHSTIAAASSVLGAVFLYSRLESATKTEEESKKLSRPGNNPFRIETHLMDKIQQKSYVASSRDEIPSSLRILAIDLPEMRTDAFEGECRLAHDKLFLEDVAVPMKLPIENADKQEGNAGKGSKQRKGKKLDVPQKTLVKQRVGVELLEASVKDLNKHGLRKTQQVGNFKYDPGKYYESEGVNSDGIVDKLPSEQATETQATKNVTSTQQGFNETMQDIPEGVEDEFEAPWNQYAWAEEMKLRINGQIGFDASLERAPKLNRALFGQAYKVTVHPVSYFWEWPLPSFARSNPDGIDGRYRTNCRASNKPHAVIANGAALQRVPSSMRLLQKLCKKADVPLFVIHDPRMWGGNTHGSLPEALKDMRTVIKNRIITRALEQQGSTAFTRGRMLGQVETEAKWQLREAKRKSKELFIGKGGRRRKSDSDWSQLDSNRLERRLVQRGLIKETTTSDGEGSSIVSKTYSESLVELARRCLIDVDDHATQKGEEAPSATPSVLKEQEAHIKVSA